MGVRGKGVDIMATLRGRSVGMDSDFSCPKAGPNWSVVRDVDREPTFALKNKESKTNHL